MQDLTGILVPGKFGVSDEGLLDRLALAVSLDSDITFLAVLEPNDEEYLKLTRYCSEPRNREQTLGKIPELNMEGVMDLSEEKFNDLLRYAMGQKYGVDPFSILAYNFYGGCSRRKELETDVENWRGGVTSVCNTIGEGPEQTSRKYPFRAISFRQVCGEFNKKRTMLAIGNWAKKGYRVSVLDVFQPQSHTALDDFQNIGSFEGNLFSQGKGGVNIMIKGNPSKPFFDFSLSPPNRKQIYSENLQLVMDQISEGQRAYVSSCD